MRSFLRPIRSDSRGVSTVQLALVIPILIFMTLAIVDLSRLLAIEAILNKGAEDGVSLAVKLANIDNDFRGKLPASNEYQWYRDARRRVLVEATRLPLRTMITDWNVPSGAQLIGMRMEDSSLGGAVAPVQAGAALIRPGESVKFDATGVKVQHLALPEPGGGGNTTSAPRTLMQYYPIEVEVRALVQPYLPFLGPKTLRGVALGYREQFVPPGPISPEAGYGSSPTTTTTTTTSSTTTVSLVTTTTGVVACVVVPFHWQLAFTNSLAGSPQCPDPLDVGCTPMNCSATVPPLATRL